MPHFRYHDVMAEKTAHAVIEDFLLGEDGRKAYNQTVQALLARNALLALLETSRAAEGITKTELAKRAGLDASSVRRLLTSKTANPTTDNAFRLMAAMGIKLEATLPTGERVPLIEQRTRTAAKRPTAGRKVAAA
jgi:DNA-binding phage protein